MDIYEKIIYKILHLENNIFSYYHNKKDRVDGIYKFFFGCFINNNNTKIYKNKFHFLSEMFDNFYFSNRLKERNIFSYYFYKIQKTYHTLNRFCYLYKVKKANLIVNTDLQLNDIHLGQKNVICIYHNNAKYLFKLEDLLKIVYTSLTNSYLFFSEPFSVKNPYNNLPFGKSILYYIYFYLIKNAQIGYIKNEHLDLFLKFKQCNFNMTCFVDNYEYILRECAIKNYIINSTKTQLQEEIYLMLVSHNTRNMYNKIRIDKNFPTDELVEIMKPYLYLYLKSKYSLVEKNKLISSYYLNRRLLEFQKFNPRFGRKYIIYIHIKDFNDKILETKSHIEFDIKHKKFNTHNEFFMENHLSYKYDMYEVTNNDIDTDNEDNDTNSNTNNVIRQPNNSHINFLVIVNDMIQQQDQGENEDQEQYNEEDDVTIDEEQELTEEEYEDDGSIS